MTLEYYKNGPCCINHERRKISSSLRHSILATNLSNRHYSSGNLAQSLGRSPTCLNIASSVYLRLHGHAVPMVSRCTNFQSLSCLPKTSTPLLQCSVPFVCIDLWPTIYSQRQ
ncbi:unknown protein [Desulfotalea psychrophila LSv54]|uniref:Uncharacterized protein n=1 Tax=Desulfotalea psychrophila (strain LSv54 / DSM 12343) TaxID=177439 RepID=Q6AP11_DESPS|nr:unknown protein [Desulfotalea psychrophila LSv54]